MAKDVRALREEAAEATAGGKYKRALAAYLELERLEPRDAQWAKRAGETYKRLGNTKNAIEAFERSAERYAQNGFLVQAIAVCKLILQINPQHANALHRLAVTSQQQMVGPTRAADMAEHNLALHANPAVDAIRRASTPSQAGLPMIDDQRLRSKPSTPPGISMSRTRTGSPNLAVSRTKSKPIALSQGAALDTVDLKTNVEGTYPHDETNPGIHVIPLDENERSGPIIEIEAPGMHYIFPEVTESTELELSDLDEIPLPEPRAIGVVAQRALAATPLFAGLPSDALEALVGELSLVVLKQNEHLFREGDVGDALYVIVEGEVSVQAEGPPRVEMARLGPGSFLGEVALMTDQPRSATVTAVQTSELLRIDRNTLSRVLSSHGDVLRAVLRFVRDRLVDRWMRTSPLFRPFADQERIELAAKFLFLEIDAGTTLLGVGSRADGLYIVLAGQFVVQRGGATVATLGPGDLIGETALLSGGAFRSEVISRGKSLALCLPAQDFREVIMTHPHVLEYIGEQAEHSRRLQIL